MELEKEFNLCKAMLLFNKTCQKIDDYNKAMESIELPRFMDKDLQKDADEYVTRVINENRLNEILLSII